MKRHGRWLTPLVAAILIAPFTPWLDLALESYFYSHGNDPATHFMTSPFLNFSYDWLIWIPNVFAIAAFFSLICKKIRKPALVVVLTMIVGCGLITHAFLKDYWGRPRPKQIELYGGTQEYRPFWKPNFFNQTEPSKSFVCGHCSVGFLFFTLVVLGQRFKNRRLTYTGLFLALTLGGILSYTRMAQGGHYFSDCLFSALILWWTALMMDSLVYADENAH